MSHHSLSTAFSDSFTEQQDEIAKLKALKELTPTDAARLSELEAELQKINAKKEEYIKEHPEHRRLVYRPRPKEGDAPAEEVELPTRKLFKKNGLPRHPERSVYYDAVMNPFGVAPPGMPYMERRMCLCASSHSNLTMISLSSSSG